MLRGRHQRFAEVRSQINRDLALTECKRSIAELEAYIEDLLTGKAWLESQRVAWADIAASRAQSIAELQAQKDQIDAKLKANDSVLNRIRSLPGIKAINFFSKTKLF